MVSPRLDLYIAGGLAPQPASPVLSSRLRQGRVLLWASSCSALWPSIRAERKTLSHFTGLCEGSQAIAGCFEREMF